MRAGRKQVENALYLRQAQANENKNFNFMSSAKTQHADLSTADFRVTLPQRACPTI
jgi:hypothetical protein